MVVSPSQAPPGGHPMHDQSFLSVEVSLRYCALPQAAAVVQDGLAQAVCRALGSSPLTVQVLQVCWPRVSWYWLGGQSVQVPSLVPYLPKSQPLQMAAPVLVVVRPGSHRWHWVASSSSVRANPKGQFSQPMPNVPKESAYVPGAHSMQAMDPSLVA